LTSSHSLDCCHAAVACAAALNTATHMVSSIPIVISSNNQMPACPSTVKADAHRACTVMLLAGQSLTSTGATTKAPTAITVAVNISLLPIMRIVRVGM